jgi:hypothetical protein
MSHLANDASQKRGARGLVQGNNFRNRLAALGYKQVAPREKSFELAAGDLVCFSHGHKIMDIFAPCYRSQL